MKYHLMLILIVIMMSNASICYSVELTAYDVAKRLDIMSFPNSIQPRRKPGLRTFAQYGFTEIVPSERFSNSVDVFQSDHL